MTPVIQIECVEKTYQTGDVEVKAVKSVSLTIEKGEFVAFMGSSGSGKSTLMNILGCLDRPTAGRYLLDGIDVSKLNRDELAAVRNHKLGFVFQSFNLLSRTSAMENVELPMLYAERRFSSREMRARADHALELVGLTGRSQHHPNELSGGQQQRVAIARALINDPEVLLADEPTGNLDSRMSIEIMTIFQHLNDQGITVIMVTHEPDIAQYTKRNVIMKDGLIKSDRPVEHRLVGSDELARYVGVA
jgi:putative ABC transport system ATP-binding protein